MNIFNDLTNFYVIGISYKNADLHTRGRFNLSRSQKIKILEKAKRLGISEILINNTCNRTEIYSFAKSHLYLSIYYVRNLMVIIKPSRILAIFLKIQKL